MPYISGTFFVDGILLITGFKAVELIITYVVKRRNRHSNGARTEPGHAQICREHGESIAALGEFKKNTEAALNRIENKVDKLLARER